MTTPTSTRPHPEPQVVGVGAPHMPYTEKLPGQHFRVPGKYPIYATESPWNRVGELWFTARTGKWWAYRAGYGVRLDGQRDTPQEALAVVGWTARSDSYIPARHRADVAPDGVGAVAR